MLPNLIVIGAMKAGTTSLHYYLSLHPDIRMSEPKELHFFVAERNWDKGVKWYESHFVGQASIHGEASPTYANFPHFKGVPKRMHSVVPDAKLIYVLRDPVERIVSHYIQAYSFGKENRPFHQAVFDETTEFLFRSRYALQLKQFLEFYSPDRILLLRHDDLHSDREGTMRKVFRFLGVDETFTHPNFSWMLHPSGGKRRPLFIGIPKVRDFMQTLPPALRYYLLTRLPAPLSRKIERPIIDPETRSRLASLLRDDFEELRELTESYFPDFHLDGLVPASAVSLEGSS